MKAFQFSNQLQLKNPLLLAPMTTDSGTATGGLSQEDCEFILSRSENFGAVILGSHSISKTASAFEHGWNIYDPNNHQALRELTTKLHRQDVKVIVQLYHAGRLTQPAFIENKQPIAPSRVPAKRNFASYPREMTEEEVLEVIQDFRDATQLAGELGLDGVEIHGANTYLVQQFYSPHSNRRTDKWGGSREKRLQFPLEVIKACHELRPDRPFVIGYRFSPEEYESPGIRMKDTAYLLERITSCPIDYVHISLSDLKKKSLAGEPIIKELKKVVPDQMPFIGCGNIVSQEDVTEALTEFPLLSVGNAALIDPDWATKIINKDASIKTINPDEQTMPKRLWKIISASPQRYFDFTKEGLG